MKPADPEQENRRLSTGNFQSARILRDFLVSMGLALVLAFANAFYFDRSGLGQRIERMTYEMLQGQLSPNFSTSSFPVALVDIGNLARNEVDQGEPVTPRESLIDLILAVADQEPRAIGVDIDFSPDAGGYAPNDFLFFKTCEIVNSAKGIPVYLGAGRTLAEDPSVWLPGAPTG
jgi:CHASE2 domain-containing sensor protein